MQIIIDSKNPITVFDEEGNVLFDYPSQQDNDVIKHWKEFLK